MNKYSQIFQTPYINTYQAPDINAFAKAAGMIRDRYDTNLQTADLLEDGLEQLKAADFDGDKQILQDLKASAQATTQQWAEAGNYEDLAPEIRRSAKEFAKKARPIQENKARWDAYKEEVLSLENLSEQQKMQRLALGSEAYTGLTQDEYGEWKYFSGNRWNAGINVPEWTDKVLDGTEFDSYALYEALDNGHIRTDVTGRYVITESGVQESRSAQRIVNVLNAAIEGDPAVQGYIADEAKIAEATTPTYDTLTEEQKASFSQDAAQYRSDNAALKNKSDSEIYGALRDRIVNEGVTSNIFAYGQAKYQFSRLKSYNMSVKTNAYALAEHKKSLTDLGMPPSSGDTIDNPKAAEIPSLSETQQTIASAEDELESLAENNTIHKNEFLQAYGDEVAQVMEEREVTQEQAIDIVAYNHPSERQFLKARETERAQRADLKSKKLLLEQDMNQLRKENPEAFQELDALSQKYGINDPTNYEEVMQVLEAMPEYQNAISSVDVDNAMWEAKGELRSGKPQALAEIVMLAGAKVLGAGAKRKPRTAAEAMQVLEILTNDSSTGWYSDRARQAAGDTKAVGEVEKAYQTYRREHLPPKTISLIQHNDEKSIKLGEYAGEEILRGTWSAFTAVDGTSGEQVREQVINELGSLDDITVVARPQTGAYTAAGGNVIYGMTFTNKKGKALRFNLSKNMLTRYEADYFDEKMVETFGKEAAYAEAMLVRDNQYGITYETAGQLGVGYVLPFDGTNKYLYKASQDNDVPRYLGVVQAQQGDPGSFQANDGNYYKRALRADTPSILRDVLIKIVDAE